MPRVSGLGTVFAPTAAATANGASDAIDSTLKPGSQWYDAGNLGLGTAGTTGNTLLNGAAALGQTQVGFDSSAMDADAARLGALSGQYAGLASGGGLAEAAARQQALADIANLGQGGHTAGAAITAGSRDLTNQASSVAVNERAQNQKGATQSSFQSAALALQKALYQAHTSHANRMTALAAQSAQVQLAQMQSGYNENMANAAAGARNGQQTLYQGAQADTRQTALQAATSIASLGGTAAATYAAQSGTAAQPYTTDASGISGGVALGVPSLGSANTGVSASVAMQPSMSRVAYHNPFDTEAVGNTATAPNPDQWSQWLTGGSTLAP